MINLKKLFRRKKGQGALEYLFMVAAALIIIFVVVRHISGTGSQASSQVAIASLQSQAELAKTNLQAKNFWEDTASISVGKGGTITIGDYTVDATGTTYESEVTNSISGYSNLEALYDACMDKNDETACKILISLGEAKWTESS
jgi:uncharacterized protein (UPF0333 family)